MESHSGIIIIPQSLEVEARYEQEVPLHRVQMVSIERKQRRLVAKANINNSLCRSLLTIQPAEVYMQPLHPVNVDIIFKDNQNTQMGAIVRGTGDAHQRLHYNNTETVCHVDFMEYADNTHTGDFESLTVNIRAMPGLPSYMTSEIEVATPNVTIASTASLRIVPRDGQVRSSTSLAHQSHESVRAVFFILHRNRHQGWFLHGR